jgi:hypothetical protein
MDIIVASPFTLIPLVTTIIVTPAIIIIIPVIFVTHAFYMTWFKNPLKKKQNFGSSKIHDILLQKQGEVREKTIP